MRPLVGASASGIVRWPRQAGRLRRIRNLLAGPEVLDKQEDAAAYASLLHRLYAVIADVTSARVIVDSTKHPAEGLLACSHPDIEAFALHLVRDPRAVLHSRVRLAGWRPDALGARGRSSVYSSARWTARNWLAEAICRSCATGRSTRVRYEDLVSDPSSILASILNSLGEAAADPPTIHERMVHIEPGHVLAGNLTKFKTGPVEIREDLSWRAALTPLQRLIGTVLALPLLQRYGYRLRPSKEASR